MSRTPPWQVDEQTLEAGFAKIRQQWELITELLESPDAFALRDDAVSGWSCGQHGGHLAEVTLWIARGIEENLADPERDRDAEWSEHAGLVLESGDFPRGAAKSPPHVDPEGKERERFLGVLPTAVSAWESLAERSPLLPGCAARFPHFALGYLTSSEWVRFCAIHSAHHLAVVRDIRAAAAGRPEL